MREVKTHDWPAFCERINANARGGTISIDKVDPNGAKAEIVRNTIFENMRHGKRDDCNDHLAIRFSGGVPHEILEPIRIQLMESENGAAFQSMIVEAEDGVTILTFHPVLRAPWLAGLDLR